jgi:hypothetical protein
MYTSVEDVNVYIMLNTPFESLKQLCLTNTWAQQICQDQTFWKKKYRLDKFIIPYFENDNVNWFNDQDIDWFYTYLTMDKVYKIIKNLNIIKVKLIQHEFHLYIDLYKKLYMNYNTTQLFINDIIISKNGSSQFLILTNVYTHVGMFRPFFNYINLAQLRRLLFYLFYYNFVNTVENTSHMLR